MKVELEEILSTLHVISLPLRTKFRGLDYRETAIFRGSQGWAEFAPFVEYDDTECVPWLASALEAGFGSTPASHRSEIPINGTIPATDSKAEIVELVGLYPGAEVFKIKVGTSLRSDIARIAIVRSLVPKAKIRIDVNGAWSVADAVTHLRAIYGEATGSALEYVEQPVGTLNELRELKKKISIDIKIAGDEVIRKAKDPFALDLDGAIDILMLKVAPLGGVARSLDIAAHHKLPVVVSSALESAIGISHGLRLAAAIPDLNYACGLATGSLFSSDIAAHPIHNGMIRVESCQPQNMDGLAVSAERLEWWRERIKRVWQVMM